MRQIQPETGESLAIFQITNQTLYVVLLLLLSGSQTIEDHTFDPIYHDIYIHDEVNNDSTIPSKMELNKSVLITLFKKVYLNLEKPTLRKMPKTPTESKGKGKQKKPSNSRS